jgi:16S rRNA (cytosine1402-N4)-methyltransferase
VEHTPILPLEIADALLWRLDGAYVDATFGRGGHSRVLLDRLADNARLLVVDRDPEAIAAAHGLAAADSRVRVAQGRFSELQDLAQEAGFEKVSGVVMDLGVSSPQLDDPDRGFSFRFDAPLDMRMDPTSGERAADWLNAADEAELARTFREYGEERYARRIARAIVARRESHPLHRTDELVAVIDAAQPRRDRHKHAATRVFQAIRIQINGELEELDRGLDAAFELLEAEGRLAVLSFHSLEDRLVKRRFRRWSEGEPLPRRLPVTGERHGRARLVIKSRAPDAVEIERNPRARSARLRVIEKRSRDQA